MTARPHWALSVTHTSVNGRVATFSEADVKAIAEGYDPQNYEAPVVIGHPKTDAPAWGWVKALRFVDGALKAVLHRVSPEFAAMVKDGKFRNRSVALYAPEAPGNPTPGKAALKHLGFLGATPPAVKGLKPLAFADDDQADAFEFADPAGESVETAAMRAELEALRAEKRGREIGAVVDELVREGRLLPREREGVTAFMDAVAGSGVDEFEFADPAGQVVTKAPLEFLTQFFRNRPKIVEFGEIARSADAFTEGADTPHSRAQKVLDWVDAERAKGRNVTFADYPG